MDLLVPRSGIVWEGDCYLNMLYYRLVVLALAPQDWFREPFGIAALRRDVSLILDASTDKQLPSHVGSLQWARLAIMFKIVAERAEAEPLPGMPSSQLMQWAMRSWQYAGATEEESRSLPNSSISREWLAELGFEKLYREDGAICASFVFANNTLGHYLRRLIMRLQ